MSRLNGVLLAAVSLLAGCFFGGGNGSQPEVEGAVVKGPVLGATVCAYLVVGGAKGGKLPLSNVAGGSGAIANGCYVTGSDGSYRFALPEDQTGDVLLEASGGTFCSNESLITNNACAAGGTVVSMGTAVMTSVARLSSARQTVYTTPLSTAAVSNASGGSGLSAVSFNAQFGTLARQLLGTGSAVTAATAPTAATQPYLLQVAAYMQAGGSLSTAVSSLASGTTTFPAPSTSSPGSTTSGNTTTAVVNAAVVGTHTLVFKRRGGEGCGTLCSFSEDQTVTAVVHGDGRLSIAGKELTSPFNRSYGGQVNAHEIIWLDQTTKVEYALSDNSGAHFNEINVGDASRMTATGTPTFLGQLRVREATGPAALTALAGTYRNAYQYTGNHGLYGQWATVTIGSDGAITFSSSSGNLPSVTASQITTVTPCISACGLVNVQVSRDINGDGQANDSIILHVDNTGALRAIAWDPKPDTIDDNVGIRVLAQDAPALALLTHTGAAPTAATIAATIQTTPLSFSTIAVGTPSTSGLTLEGTATTGGARLRVQLRPGVGVSLVQGGTYGCYYSPASDTRITATLPSGTMLTSVNGGRCTITVSSMTVSGGALTRIAGTFVAELHDNSRQNATPQFVLDGTFDWAR